LRIPRSYFGSFSISLSIERQPMVRPTRSLVVNNIDMSAVPERMQSDEKKIT
jgi:hypothetical protein